MDGLRALREARYAERVAGATKPATKPAAAPKRTAPKKTGPGAAAPPETPPPPAADAEVSADQLCGHRAISGRLCTRELGHAAKSHRYS